MKFVSVENSRATSCCPPHSRSLSQESTRRRPKSWLSLHTKSAPIPMLFGATSRLGSPFRLVEQDRTKTEDLIMIFNNLKNSFVSAAAFLVLAGTAVPVLAAPVKNIVLVHGAFVDGSGWKPVYDILVKDGYSVTVVQHPLTSLEEDVAATERILDRQPGPCILVGHSYRAAGITDAGTPYHAAALVYIAAHAPEEGGTEAANGQKVPHASKPLVQTPDGFVFLDPANFPADFAADLPRDQAEFMAPAQTLTAAKVFTTPITNPAWKLKPSWYVVAKNDITL